MNIKLQKFSNGLKYKKIHDKQMSLGLIHRDVAGGCDCRAVLARDITLHQRFESSIRRLTYREKSLTPEIGLLPIYVDIGLLMGAKRPFIKGFELRSYWQFQSIDIRKISK